MILGLLSFIFLIGGLLGLKQHGHRASVTAFIGACTASLWIVLGIAYLAAWHFTGSGIDESVLFHLRAGFQGAGIQEHLWLIAACGMGLFGAVIVGYGIHQLLPRQHPSTFSPPPPWGTAITLFSLLAAVALHPSTWQTSQLLHRQWAASIEAPIPSAHYVHGQPLASPARLNLVVMYLESIERTFLDQRLFPGLMPRLSALEQRAITFTNIGQVFGTSWTIAGMTASQCGIPLVTPGHGNSMSGTDRFLPEAYCLGDALQAQGMHLEYIGGADLGFAGKGNFYRDHGFTALSGLHELAPLLQEPDYLNPWGLYDDTLYPIVRQRFDELSEQDRPFGLFMLTLDTHPPRGHLSASCHHMSEDGERNPMLAAVHCADGLAADFIEHILQGPHAKRTLIVVLSDHLAMRNTAWAQLERGERRNLFMVFHPHLPSQVINKPGSLLGNLCTTPPTRSWRRVQGQYRFT